MPPSHSPSSARSWPIVARRQSHQAHRHIPNPPPAAVTAAAAAAAANDGRSTVRYNPITGEALPSYRSHALEDDGKEGPPPAAAPTAVSVLSGVSGVGYGKTMIHQVEAAAPHQPGYGSMRTMTREVRSMPQPAELGSELQEFDGIVRPTAALPPDPRLVAGGGNEGKVVARKEVRVGKHRDSEGYDEFTGTAGSFEEMVMAEMERLRWECSNPSSSKGSNNHHGHHGKRATSSATIKASSDHRHPPFPSLPLPGRDETEDLAMRRQKAREYGAQLRMQMEQDRLAKTTKRKEKGSRNGDAGGRDGVRIGGAASVDTSTATVRAQDGPTCTRASATPSTDGTNNNGDTTRSYGELLRIQMLEDQERRRKQKKEHRRGLAAAEATVDAIGRPDNIRSASKQQKAMEYKRQLDEQVAAQHANDHQHRVSNTRASHTKTTMAMAAENDQSGDSTNTVAVGQSTSLPSQSNDQNANAGNEKRKKEEYALQLREQMIDANIARRVQRQTLESPGGSSVLAPSWPLRDDREAQERQKRRDAALEQQRLLELQIKEQNEAKARKKQEDEAWATELLVPSPPPLPEPNLSVDKTLRSTHRPTIDVDSDGCRLLAAESTFIPAPSPTIKRNPRKDPNASTCTPIPQKDMPICPAKTPAIRRGRGGEAFTVSLLDDANRATSGEDSIIAPLKAFATETGLAAASTKKPKSSHRRRSESKSKPKPKASIHRPPLESSVVTSEGSQCGVADEDDLLVHDILRSALRRIENNVPDDGEGKSSERPQKSVPFQASSAPEQSKFSRTEVEKSDAYLPNEASGTSQTFAPPSIHIDGNNTDDELDDFDGYPDDNEEAEEERLIQALSRIRNIMDTSLTRS